MARLNVLRSQLSSLRRSRASVRWSTALAAVGVAILWILIGIFLIDWSLSMSVLQRIVAMAIGLGIVVWAYHRYSKPLLAQTESDMDMALMVERQQGIDSDLVAALQFEQPEAARWGSQNLEKAVVEYVADFSRGLNVWEGFSREQLVRRGAIFGVTALLVITGALMFSRHFLVFLSRLALSNRHYPTRTMIDEVRVNDTVVAFGDKTVRAGYGQPVDFAVRISGEMPTDVKKVELRSSTGAATHPIELKQDKKAPEGEMVFLGDLSQLVDNTTYQIFIGDDWTEPAVLEVIPLPVVELKLTPTPPAYARGSGPDAEPQAGSHRLAVLQGSRVDVEINCVNKSLTAAKLTLDKQDYALEKQDDEGKFWKLPAKDSPLAQIEPQKKYDLLIQVTDSDGMHLPHPLEGHLNIRADRPPTIMASCEGQFFLPDTGMPEISYSANDDYGIAQVQLNVEVIHQAGETDEKTAIPPIRLTKDKPATPVLRGKLPLTGVYRLPLEPYKLTKGDQVRLILEATDYRGDLPGEATKSEPLVLQITDLSGIMAALSDTDRHAYEQMNLLIQRQSQTGGLK